MKKRRDFLRNTLALAAATVTAPNLSGCVDSNLIVAENSMDFKPGSPLPWTNWAGNQSCIPISRVAPTNDEEVVDALKDATGGVRPVGAGHSFSPVVSTDGTLISTDLLSGIISHDSELLQAEVWAGTRIHNLGPMLDTIGQAQANLPDMDYPSIGGAIANSVHGTSPKFSSMSSDVVALSLVTPSGVLIECSDTKNPGIFQAARTSVGALGIVTKLKIQNVAPFELTEISGFEKTEDVLSDLDSRFAKHRLFEFFPIPYTDYSMTTSTDIAGEGDKNAGEEDPDAINKLRHAFETVAWIPGLGRSLYEKTLFKAAGSPDQRVVRTGPSYKVLPHDRLIRFREMEYTVAAELGPQCLREILGTIRKRKLPLSYPIEYRHVKGDNIWLSMFEGGDGASISIHQYGDLDYKAVFSEIEPIFWKYRGRPHWGKLHTLGATELAGLYSKHWQDFQEVRDELDPTGKMLNKHLRKIFDA